MHEQSCCFALSSYCLFHVFLVAAAFLTSYYLRYTGTPVLENFRHALSPDPTDCPWVSKDEFVAVTVIEQNNQK